MKSESIATTTNADNFIGAVLKGESVDRLAGITKLRSTLATGGTSIGSWMQLADGNVAEILARKGYEWIALDLEHGHFSPHQIPDLFRAIELGGALPLARVSTPAVINCRQALDAGAAGVVIPMITSAEQLRPLIEACHWPPTGTRGVGFCRANGFGERFEEYQTEARSSLVVGQIEHVDAIKNLDTILAVDGLDALMIGPYDLSASLGRTGQLDHPEVVNAVKHIRESCKQANKPAGTHVVDPNPTLLRQRIEEGFRFIAYGVDTVFLRSASTFPAR